MGMVNDAVRVDSTPDDVFEALTTQEGYEAWWSRDCEIDGTPGGRSTLRFDKQGMVVTMGFRTDAVEPGARVRWTCVANDAPPWVGTTLDWRIEAEDDGIRVSLEHGGWQIDPPAEVAQGWTHFLGSLKQYLETGTGQPW